MDNNNNLCSILYVQMFAVVMESVLLIRYVIVIQDGMLYQIVHNDDVLMMSPGLIKRMLWTRHILVLNVPTTVYVIDKQGNVNVSKVIVEMPAKNQDVMFVWSIYNVNIKNVPAMVTALPPERPTNCTQPLLTPWNTPIGIRIIPLFVIVNEVTMALCATIVCVPKAWIPSTSSPPTTTHSM